MKLTISVSRKLGRDFGSHGAECGLELEVDQSALDHPETLANRIRALYQFAEDAVGEQLERATAPAAGQASASVRAPQVEDRLRPGDPAYDRLHPPALSYNNGQAPAPEHNRQHAPAPEPVQGDDDLPTSGKQFAGWLSKRSDADRAKVKSLTAAWRLPPMYKSWDRDQVAAVVYELVKPGPAALPQPARGSDHEEFMRRHAAKKAEEQAAAAAWAGSNGHSVANGTNGYHR